MKGSSRLLFSALVAIGTAVPSAQAPLTSDKQVMVAGHRLHYVEAGAGPPVVLLHGLGSDARAWRQTIPALASSYHVFALDQIGFGQSDKPDIPYRVGVLVDSLTGFLDAVGLKKTTLIGNSLGGWVATTFATSHPDRLDKLVLVDSAGYGQEPSEMVRDYLARFDPAMVSAAMQLLGSMSPDDQRRVQLAAVQYFARRMSRDDGLAVASIVESIVRGEDALGSEVKQIAAPTLVVWGRNDMTIPLRVGETLAKDIPHAQKVVLDGCGHRPMGECAPAFNAAVRRFLDGKN